MKYCKYGCGNEAKYSLKSKDELVCCSKSPNSCPENKKKNSEKIKKAHKNGKVSGWGKLWKDGKNKSWNKGKSCSKIPIQDIFDGKFFYARSASTKERLYKEGYKKKQCEKCNIVEWQGIEICFELHHKDGNKKNNELENLEILCPNCHSQTKNFRGRNASVAELVDAQR